MKKISIIACAMISCIVLMAIGCQQSTQEPAAAAPEATAGAAAKAEFVPVESSIIETVKYEPSTKVLTIEFDTGSVYDYADVPAKAYDDLLKADSKGKFFHAEIKDKYKDTKVSD